LRREGYRIADEPIPGRFTDLVVSPTWPLFAVMLAGSWLSLPWFAFNGFALGSATRRRELGWVIGGFVGSGILASGFIAMAIFAGDSIPRVAFRYAGVGVVAWRLAVAYVLHNLQAKSFELHRHFGGRVRNGFPLVLGGMVLTSYVTLNGPESWPMLWFQLVAR
jgi:hypothetical protein